MILNRQIVVWEAEQNAQTGAAAGYWSGLTGKYELIQENTEMSFLKAFLKDESGATMIEYGLVAALVSVAAIIALQILGGQLQIIFNTVSSYLSSAAGGS